MKAWQAARTPRAFIPLEGLISAAQVWNLTEIWRGSLHYTCPVMWSHKSLSCYTFKQAFKLTRVTALLNNNDERQICDEILFVGFFLFVFFFLGKLWSWFLKEASFSWSIWRLHDLTLHSSVPRLSGTSCPNRGDAWPTSHCETLGISSMVSPTVERYLESIWSSDHQVTHDRLLVCQQDYTKTTEWISTCTLVVSHI